MKRVFFLGLLFSAQFALAQDVRVKIEDFSFKYDDPKGSGEATLFQHNQKAFEGVQVQVEKIGEAMNFKVTGSEEHEFKLENAPDVVMKARTMTVDDLDLSYEDSLKFSVLEGEFIGKDDELHLKNFNLKLFATTLTLLNAIAAPAIIGFNKNPLIGYNNPAAIGIPTTL